MKIGDGFFYFFMGPGLRPGLISAAPLALFVLRSSCPWGWRQRQKYIALSAHPKVLRIFL